MYINKFGVVLISMFGALTINTMTTSANEQSVMNQQTEGVVDNRVTADFHNNMMGGSYSIQFGVTTVNLTDSTGYIYPSGTRVAKFNENDGYAMSMIVGNAGGVGFGDVPSQYVRATEKKNYPAPTGTGVTVNSSYVTDAGRYETLKPVNKPAPKSKSVVPATPKATAVKKWFVPNQAKRNDGLYATAPYGYKGSKFAGRMPKSGKIYVEKKVTDKKKNVWYYGTVSGKKVWFDSKGVKVAPVKKTTPATPKATAVKKWFVPNQVKRNDGLYATAPYGYKGAKFAGRMPKSGKIYVAKKVTDKKKNVWYYGTVSGKKVWFDSKGVKVAPAKKTTPATPKATAVKKWFVPNQAKRNDGLYATAPYGYKGAKFAGRMPKSGKIYVEKKVTDKKKNVWYYGTVSGKKVWFDAKGVKLAPAKKALPMGRA